MKKRVSKQAKRASKLAKAENLRKKELEKAAKIITVKNADGDPDTVAEIIIQNKIDYTPKVSVVMPVYNVEPYLRQCLDSVINQTLKEIEIICVDDGSTDASLDILKEYAAKDNRITVITQKNLYAGVARNAGLSQAKGEYLSFLDSDDFFEPTLFEETYDIAEKEQSQIVFYQYTVYNEFNKSNEETRGIDTRFLQKKIQTFETNQVKDNLLTICGHVPWNKLINRKFVNSQDVYYQALPASNDTYFCLAILACAQKFTLLNKSLVHYRCNRSGSLVATRDKNPQNFYNAYKCVYKTLLQKGLYEKYKKTFLSAFVSTALWTLEHTVNNKDSVKAIIKESIIPEFVCGNEKEISVVMLRRLYRIYHPDIVVSLTSYPARINIVNKTIESLLDQSIKADKVILWLAPEQFPNKEADLPQELLDLREKGLIIDWYHDIKSYKKLIPTLKLYPDAIIVTADDDAIYQKTWLENLYKAYIDEPEMIHCHRAHKILLKHKKITPYCKWINSSNIFGKSGYSIFFTGLGGILYPPHSLDNNVLNEEDFMNLCPQGDDIWFWANALKNNTKIHLLERAYYNPKLIAGSQETALWQSNIYDNKNDIQILNVVNKYPEILSKLRKEYSNKAIYSYFYYPYYQYKLIRQKKIYKDKIVNTILDYLGRFRVDVKNFGKATNDLEIKGENIEIKSPGWYMNEKGKGYVLEGKELSNSICIKVIGDGKLNVAFKGIDYKINEKRYPIYADFVVIKIDGKNIIEKTQVVWHNNPLQHFIPVKDGQVITINFQQKKHIYNEEEIKHIIRSLNLNSKYVEKNIDKIISALKKKVMIADLNIVHKQQIEELLPELSTYRLDIKNVGSENNALEISANDGKVAAPKWFTNVQGVGIVLQGNAMNNIIKIKAINDGKLMLSFRGQDKRFENKRFPLWIDYKSIKIDGKEILSAPVATWHDKPYRYEMPVKDGQEITLDIEQQYHQYFEDELKDVILKLNPNNGYIKDNIDDIITQIAERQIVYRLEQIKVLPQIVANCFIPLNVVTDIYCDKETEIRPLMWLEKYKLCTEFYPINSLMFFSMNTILNAIENGISSYFSTYMEFENDRDTNYRCVTDIGNKIVSLHNFPLDKSIEDYMPKFKKTCEQQYNQMMKLLSSAKDICFVCNNQLNIKGEFIPFLVRLKELYPNKSYTLINIRHDKSNKKITKCIIGKDIKIYDIENFDKNRENPNTSLWIGNEDLWNTICTNLSLSDRVKNLQSKDNAA